MAYVYDPPQAIYVQAHRLPSRDKIMPFQTCPDRSIETFLNDPPSNFSARQPHDTKNQPLSRRATLPALLQCLTRYPIWLQWHLVPVPSPSSAHLSFDRRCARTYYDDRFGARCSGCFFCARARLTMLLRSYKDSLRIVSLRRLRKEELSVELQ